MLDSAVARAPSTSSPQHDRGAKCCASSVFASTASCSISISRPPRERIKCSTARGANNARRTAARWLARCPLARCSLRPSRRRKTEETLATAEHAWRATDRGTRARAGLRSLPTRPDAGARGAAQFPLKIYLLHTWLDANGSFFLRVFTNSNTVLVQTYNSCILQLYDLSTAVNTSAVQLYSKIKFNCQPSTEYEILQLHCIGGPFHK